jgi:hypothetical protein
MDRNCDKTENSDLNIRVKAKKCPRFKAGPELGKIQSIDVEVKEDYSDECESIELNIFFHSERKLKITDAVIK